MTTVEFLPDGRPAPRLLTWRETCAYLRLDSTDDADDERSNTALKRRLDRIVEKGFLRPCLINHKRRYSRRELNRFIDAQTDRYAEAK